jgi:signal transduction histidine kinase
LIDFIARYGEEFFRISPIRCRLDLPAEVPEVRLPAEFRHHLFLAVKEGLNNVFKHSQATEIHLRLAANSVELRVMIEDNGCGIPASCLEASGNGLANMKSRLSSIGGECDIEALPGEWTRLLFRLPLPHAHTRRHC